MDLRSGDILYGKDESEKFEVVGFIDNGAFGSVYKIMKAETGALFALKTIPTGYLDNNQLRALANEGRLAPSIKHENVVDVIYFHDGTQYVGLPPYIIMEYIPDGTLQQLLDGQRKTSKPFDNEQLTAMFLQLANGMKAINSVLIHRDIKPDNILLSKNTLKISDFGLSKVVGAATRTYSFKGIQHIHYMAPEAWRLETNTIQMDIYSMGIVFYELATLHHPYTIKVGGDIIEAWRDVHFFQKAEVPMAKNPALSVHLSQLMMKMISKRPGERYSNWEEIILRIQTAQTGEKLEVDVTKLVLKAVSTKDAEEKRRLESEKKQKERKELEKTVHFRCDELLNGLQDFVDAFNSSYEGPKFKILGNSTHMNEKRVSASFPGGGAVNVFAEPVYEAKDFDGKQIIAWGYFQNTKGKGFNIILVKENPEDIYGHWLSLHNDNSGFSRKPSVGSFPFIAFEQLTQRILHLHAMDVYETVVGNFDKNMLMPLFEEIL